MIERIIEDVRKYYSEKIVEHGPTPQGVDWNGAESQNNRFRQLLNLINNDNNQLDNFSLLDFGCGYGSLLSYLKKNGLKCNYFGYDISLEMLNQANLIFPNEGRWINNLSENIKVDFVVASGLFNVKQDVNPIAWEKYIFETLDVINSISIKGFSFNILSSYSDEKFMKDYLYYASPELFFKQCKLKYSKQVAILHDYNLYEFTIIIRK